MNLKVLLPFKVFLQEENITRMVVETKEGFMGLLPRRLDCVSILVPGILEYETSEGISYIALDEGVMMKAGAEVTISVRNAIAGADLGKLHELVLKEFVHLNETEKMVRSMMAKLESTFIKEFEKFRRE